MVKRLLRNLILSLFVIVSFFPAKAEEYDEEALVEAIAYYESGLNETRKSSDGTCVGYLQIKAVLVEECNRIVGRRLYTRKDRYSKGKSVEMFRIIQGYYNPKRDLTTAIRLWNEGPSHKKRPNRQTRYLKKVTERYNRNLKGI